MKRVEAEADEAAVASARDAGLARARALAERELSAEELDAWVSAPWDPADREEALALIAWHRRRYPTPLARLRHAREAYERWTTNRVVAAGDEASGSRPATATGGRTREG